MTEQTFGVSRRIVFQGMGALGTAVALAGCSSDEGSATDEGSTPDTGTELAVTSEVPVGGGLILREEKIVITQPTEGDFKAFTAVCTHQGCLVGQVAEGTIQCPCHGSQFSIEDGSVVGGPAPSGLASKDLVVDGGSINLA